MLNRSRNLNIVALTINILMVLLEITALIIASSPTIASSLGTQAQDISSLKYYTLLTGLITLIAAFLMIWSNSVSIVKGIDCTPRLFTVIRMVSAAMSTLTFLTVVIFLAPNADGEILFGIQNGFIFFHFICPILSIGQFIFVEIEPKIKFKRMLVPFLLTVFYALIILIITLSIAYAQGAEEGAHFAPYFFFLVTPSLAKEGPIVPGPFAVDYLNNIFVALIVLVSSLALSFIVWVLNRFVSLLIIGIEYGAKEPKENKSKSLKEFIEREVRFEPIGKRYDHVYHISFHDRFNHTWKVKSEGAERALKVFPNQKEAINYAKGEVKKHGGSIRIHSMVGLFRKA